MNESMYMHMCVHVHNRRLWSLRGQKPTSLSLCLSVCVCLHLLRTHASSFQVPGPDDDGLPPWREDDDGVDTFGDIVHVDLSAPEGMTLKADEPELVKPLDCWPVGMTREQWEHAKKHGFSPPPPAPPNLPPAAHFWSLGGGISFSMERRSKREPRFWEKWPSPPMPPPRSFLEDALGLPPLTEEVVDEVHRTKEETKAACGNSCEWMFIIINN